MFIRPLFNKTVFIRNSVRRYSSCNYHYMMSPFSASMMTISFCFLIEVGIRNDIDYLCRQQEEIKKLLKELKESK